MIKLYVLVVLPNPVLRGMLCLSNRDLPILAHYAVYTGCFQAKVTPDRAEATGGRPTVLILCLHSALLTWLKVEPTKGKEVTDVRSCLDVPTLSGGFRT
jgi:hypothetical protein